MTGDTPRSMLRRAIPLAVAALIALAPLPIHVQVMPRLHLTPADPLVWLLAFGAVVTLGFRESWPFLRPFLFWGGGLVVWTMLSTFRSPAPMRSVAEAVQVAEYLLLGGPLLAWALSEPPSRRFLFVVSLLTLLGVLVWGAWHYWCPGVLPFDVRGPFANRTVYGGFAAMGLAGLAAFGLYSDSATGRVVAAAAVILFGLSTVLAGGAWLALIMAVALVAAFRGWSWLAGWWVLLLVGGLALAPLLPRENLRIVRESIAVFDEEGDLVRRYAEWQAAAEMAADHPWFGVGAGCYQARIGEYYGVLPIAGGRPAEPDSQNLYLVLAGSLGYPGLLAFAGLLLAALAGGVKAGVQSRTFEDRAVRFAGVGIVLAFMVAAVWSPLLIRGIGWGLALGLAAALAPFPTVGERS